MPTLRQADFVDRTNFPGWLNRTGRTGNACEVGTHRADFAAWFLLHWEGKSLTCVDHYLQDYDPEDPAARGDRHQDRRHAEFVLRKYLRDGRAEMVVMSSEEASYRFPDGHFDFVYLDACHRREAVREDLRLWWPKVRGGGVLAGHDFVCHGTDRWHEFIQPEVFALAEEAGCDVWAVCETMTLPWSFYLEKP